MNLPEGGFGWALIRDLTSDLLHHRVEGMNQLEFQVPLSGDQ